MRKKVAENGKLRKPTAVSLGIASLRREKISHEGLVKEADRALYQAKAQGRNRTVIYEKWMAGAAHAPEPPKTPAQAHLEKGNPPGGKPDSPAENEVVIHILRGADTAPVFYSVRKVLRWTGEKNDGLNIPHGDKMTEE
jgi:hypothetical protein